MDMSTDKKKEKRYINYNETIHVFGNSHAALFTGAPPSGNIVSEAKEKPRGRGYTDKHPTLPFRTWYLGSVLAYTFYDKHLPKVKEHIEENKSWFPPGTKIVLMVGEIDCRVAIPKQATFHPNKTREEMVHDVIDRFFESGVEIERMGYEPIFFGMCPTTDPDFWFNPSVYNPNLNPDLPVLKNLRQDWFSWGDQKQRNEFSLIWNSYMRKKCDEKDYAFISIYDHIVDSNNNAKNEFFIDSIHLKHSACIDLIVKEFANENIIIEPK